MFHLEYPSRKGFFSRQELGCLARALGYDGRIFEKCVGESNLWKDGGMRLQDIQHVLDYKLLHETLHLSFNMHSDEWNVSLIRKAVTLLNLHILSFMDLHRIRIAYQTYERHDSKGLDLNPTVILVTLKMCGRTISLKKLIHRIKHYRGGFESQECIQLHEFIDILRWCVVFDEYDTARAPQIHGTTDDHLYHLLNFKSLLCHHDERLALKLDRQFWKDERDFGKTTHIDDVISSRGQPILKTTCTSQVEKAKKDQKILKTALNKSENRLRRSKNCVLPSKPFSALDVSNILLKEDLLKGGNQRKEESRQKLQSYLSQRVRHSKVKPSPHAAIRTPRRPLPSYVTPDDLHDVKAKTSDLQFNMSTLEGRYRLRKEKNMAAFIPKYEIKHDEIIVTEDESIQDIVINGFESKVKENRMLKLKMKPKSAPPCRKTNGEKSDVIKNSYSRVRAQSSMKRTSPDRNIESFTTGPTKTVWAS